LLVQLFSLILPFSSYLDAYGTHMQRPFLFNMTGFNRTPDEQCC